MAKKKRVVDFSDEESTSKPFKIPKICRYSKPETVRSNCESISECQSQLRASTETVLNAKPVSPEAPNVLKPSSTYQPFPQLQSIKKENVHLWQESSDFKNAPAVIQKHSVSVIYEKYPAALWECEEVFSIIPTKKFRVTLKVSGECYEGCAPSKKEAKRLAADECLLKRLNMKSSFSMATLKPPTSPLSVDSMSKEDEKTSKLRQKKLAIAPGTPLPTELENNAIMKVYEIYGTDKCVINFEENSQNPAQRFQATLRIEDKCYEGAAASKKKARNACALQVLGDYGYIIPIPPPVTDTSLSKDPSDTIEQHLQEFADKVAELSQAKYSELCAYVEEHARRKKVLAACILYNNSSTSSNNSSNDTDPLSAIFRADGDMEVIAMTTGTKVLGGEFLSCDGKAINDSHAEIQIRRCIMRFLYGQLRAIREGRCSVLEKVNDKYRLKPEFSLHLYINTAPCGDARIFSPKQEGSQAQVVDVDTHPNRSNRGVLRTKIESGEGTIPILSATEAFQTWDGVLAGQRLRTMSCSDKLCRSNLLGLQGSLLSKFLCPLYYSSVVVGRLYSFSHLSRALYGRLDVPEVTNVLPEGFYLNKPLLLPVSVTEARSVSKASGFCMNWTYGDAAPEVTRTSDGKVFNANNTGTPSRICKNSLFKLFIKEHKREVAAAKTAGTLTEDMEGKYDELMYYEVKNEAKDYNKVKNILIDHFKNSNLGCWVRKPIEQSMFSL